MAKDSMSDHSLISLDQVCLPDAKNTYFYISNSGAEEVGKLDLKELYEVVSSIKLMDTVPDIVHSQFSKAQNTAIYSWFHYPFNVTSQLMSFIALELTLKMRLGTKAPFKALLRRAVKEQLVSDEGFRICKHRLPMSGTYVETLIEVLPNLRNRLAHGSDLSHNNCLSSLQISADFINQIYP